MGTSAELPRDAHSAPSARRRDRRVARRSVTAQTFAPSMRALEELATAGAQISVRVDDLDRRTVVLAGDDHLVLPVAGLGIVPLLIEVAARFEDGSLDPFETIDRRTLVPERAAGIWSHLATPLLPLADLAVLAAAAGDTLAANALLARVGLDGVRARIEALGLTRMAIMDHFRDRRSPDDVPHAALGSAREYAALLSAVVSGHSLPVSVSERIAHLLSLNHDLGLVGAATGLDPFAHADDPSRIVLVNKTGREPGVRAEAGVFAGPRAAVSYALIVHYDERAILQGVRVDECFRTFGLDLMEFVY